MNTKIMETFVMQQIYKNAVRKAKAKALKEKRQRSLKLTVAELKQQTKDQNTLEAYQNLMKNTDFGEKYKTANQKRLTEQKEKRKEKLDGVRTITNRIENIGVDNRPTIETIDRNRK
eukprot:TRINITY_DN4219_c0_g2_i1.p1 TRINITY_DN4219_c0_g2~~TRINITY_DN4219_c0_g2_i1.p1  ORF type:complete len:117 (-),score=16.49 TRINITY_DN4219_c0_g2_i1:4-354(-)